MANGAKLIIKCPWCGLLQTQLVYSGATTEIICDGGLEQLVFHLGLGKGCKKRILIVTDKKGKPTTIRQLHEDEKVSRQTQTNRPLISVENWHGNLALGDNVSITNIYEQTIKIINESQNVTESRKKEAKGLLEYVKNYSPSFMPIVADALKRMLGL